MKIKQSVRAINYLKGYLKAQEMPNKSVKFRKFQVPGETKQFYFVGRNGAVRFGANVSDSISLTEFIFINIREWESLQVRGEI